MTKRKTKIIDKAFQMKVTYSVLGVILITFLAVISILGVESTQQNREISKMIDDINSAIYVEDSIIKAFIDYSNRKDNASLRISKEKIIKDHNDTIQTLKEYTKLLKKREDRNFIIISAIIGIVLLLAVFLYFYLINITHRISGPLHVVKGYMEDIIEGRYPKFRDLREKDEFKDLYYSFVRMVEEITEKNSFDHDESKDDAEKD